ncbi:hypothetical protein T190_31540 [Sinorhizobium meliloti CCBAU 01290]|nr:hypothetical protein T190_31540 [Sinorhizobium meliloti CCBAU 01290]
MTMEASPLGSHLHPLRLALLLLAIVPTLVLHKYGGFRKSVGLRDRIADALVFLLVAAIASSAILFISGIVDADMRYSTLLWATSMQRHRSFPTAMVSASEIDRAAY